ncbi:MAG: Lrp/AsnC ligand binding domain-containing protein [Candidatus Bathyarchaeota archaeon]|nr:Lrp/AsnC ligand binding domain-containing protein [Candidatus Bathyarchaeota archaeon]MDH5788901.1 Lrp/AsnC ligand binding domain-containing protein [Candidatus Bathyarchaeota archaeon]
MPVEDLKRTVRAFVLLKVELGKEQKVMEDLLKLAEVKEVHEIPGQYDVLVVLDFKRDMLAPSTQKIADFVSGTIGKIHGVHDSDTMMPTRSRVKV